MRIAFALVASLAALGLSTPSTAQVISVSQVLTQCPDFAAAQACPGVATEFLEDRRPGPRRNGQVVNLVVAIAEAAQPQTVPRPVCLNAAEGLRVLATGVTNEDQAKQITDIADALCLGTRTAALRPPRRLGGLFDSLAGGGGAGGGGGSGGSGGNTPVIVPEEGCPPNCSGGGESGGGLGSNGAGKGNENAVMHANIHATDNHNGNNVPKDK